MRIGIVGCSINGGYLAYKLAGAGHEVSVFERKDKIGNKPCSGLISERLWKFIPKDESLVENIIDSVKIHFPQKTISVRFKQKMFANNRHSLDNYVFGLAKKAGAEILLGAPVEKIDVENLKIISNKKEFQFDRIIGCDGSQSVVRKSLGLKEPRYRMGIYVYTSEKGSQDFVDAWPTANGFFWKIPRGDHAEWGLIDEPKISPAAFDKFLKESGVEKSKVFSTMIPEGPIVSGRKNIVLCGDAAGLTKPWSGGGIIWGMTAANKLIENLDNLERYNKFVKNFFGRKIKLSRMQTKLVGKFGKFLPRNFPIAFDADFGII